MVCTSQLGQKRLENVSTKRYLSGMESETATVSLRIRQNRTGRGEDR